jgi:hypothetical protein
MRTSILGSFFLASPLEVQEGRSWYQNANSICRDIGGRYDIPTATVAGVIAALSPQNPWERNVADADNMCDAYVNLGRTDAETIKVGTFGANKRKALDVLDLGVGYGGMAVLNILNGLKVQNFFESILLNQKSVCVDGHAYSIWLGERVSTSDTPKITPKLYDRIKQDYISSTDKINSILDSEYTPSQIQAITWIVHRNMYRGRRKLRRKQST